MKLSIISKPDALSDQAKDRELKLAIRHWMRYRDHSGRDRILIAARERDSGLWYAFTLPEVSIIRSEGYPMNWAALDGLKLWCELWLKHWGIRPEPWHQAERWAEIHLREELEP